MVKGALENIPQGVGHTPIVKLNRVALGVAAEIYVKCEYLNPGGSHKDRVALNMIRRAEEAGIRAGGPIVEATRGRPRAAPGLLARSKGDKCLLTLRGRRSQKRRPLSR